MGNILSANRIVLSKVNYLIPVSNCIIKLFIKLSSLKEDISSEFIERLEKITEYLNNFSDLENLEMNLIIKTFVQAFRSKELTNDIFLSFEKIQLLPISEKAQSMVVPPQEADLSSCFPLNDEELNLNKTNPINDVKENKDNSSIIEKNEENKETEIIIDKVIYSPLIK